MRRWGSILALLILTGIAGWGIQPPPLPSPPFQEVTVCPEGPPECDFTSIEAATGIVTGGGIIKVLPGVYEENIDIGKSLTLKGTVGVTIIAKDPEQSVIYVNSGVENVTITGLTIIGSNNYGIVIGNGAKGIVIKGNFISQGDKGWQFIIPCRAGGILVEPHAQVTIDGNLLSLNSIAIEIDAAKADIVNNKISGAWAGIGIFGGVLKISGNIINYSFEGIGVAADHLTPVSIDISNNIVTHTERSLEVSAGKWGTVHLKGNILTGNTLGGMIWVQSLEAQGNYILNSGNSSTQREGQGLIILATEKINLVGNVIIGNDSSGLILGLVQSGEIKVEENVVLNNIGYGLALLNPDCIHTYVKELLEVIIPEEEWDEIEDKLYQGQLQGEVRGSGNLIVGNKEGDLCPPDYPWPEGFVKEP
jgi:hypothetical protein